MSSLTCLNCGISDQERPLLPLRFQGQNLAICPQCLPTLIHKPYQLADKLSNFTPSENLPPEDH